MPVELPSRRWLVVLFGTTIFLSALLLFGIQPLLSKAILPWFGGSSAVWTTCMLFFQVVLFSGYAYAHLLVRRLRPGAQAMVHLVVLGLALGWLGYGLAGDAAAPVLPGGSWKPSAEADPTWQVLLLLAVTIGWPYFVLSTTGPLLQAWYGRLRPGTVPYRLYALSNAGSLLALLGYPFVVEPGWDLGGQGFGWSVLFVGFVVLAGIVAWLSRRPGGMMPGPEEAAGGNGVPGAGPPPLGTLAAICLVAGVLTWGWLIGILSGLVAIEETLALRAVTGPGLVGLCLLPAGWGMWRGLRWGIEWARGTLWLLLGISLVAWLWQDGPSLVGGGRGFDWTSLVQSLSPAVLAGFLLWCLDLPSMRARFDNDCPPPQPPAIPTVGVRTLWFLLAAAPSVLLLAVTNHVCLDVATVPFLWVVPLALYLVSFIFCFEGERWYVRPLYLLQAAVSLVAVLVALGEESGLPVSIQVAIFFSALFVLAMVCHGELARLKPDPAHLTGFYLTISAGGAAGGVFVGVVAPRVFSAYLELHVGLVLVAALVIAVLSREAWARRQAADGSRPPSSNRIGVAAIVGWTALTAAMLFVLGRMGESTRRDVIEVSRNFYGVLRVREERLPGSGAAIRRLVHGRTFHGLQFLEGPGREEPTSYFGRHTGVGMLLGTKSQKPRRIGIIGLGVGTLSVYPQSGDRLTFYELDPDVHQMAEKHFDYLESARRRGVELDVVIGDARLSLERQQPQGFDVLVLDAFASDAVPVHLLTREAFAIYHRHLAEDGLLALHVSTAHFQLQPLVTALAESIGMQSLTVVSAPDLSRGQQACQWMLVASGDVVARVPSLADLDTVRRREEIPPTADSAILQPTARRVLWTDSFSNPFAILVK